ncbi:methylmalonyl Co-A mutase-associated GTPase MeaB [Pontibacter cellulosilyticus]|uniref:Methylmalonyl Co-A mutase-associated GTPase MeaB n=1 Tax=Pontibacter cellulosilyticus TaxID=1720253 RepID=A0A923N928_9BACT|nr:methylmalonyl Co-A mutase-associated GTPase MeaB [Pontibacter cellulosilyticus]MBC5993137.1 methylmalonyl Co-A mutase-associated GTPase MeaB [Pontibacter cellulosilyticus]
MAKRFSTDTYVNGILSGDRVMLSRAITLVESKLATDQELAQQVINAVLPHAGNSVRIGITGVPGVGKSTFIESFGSYLIIEQGKKLAVLAIDPTSQRSGGSILGDKTRMEELSMNPQAYIRPSPAGKSLGGVAKSTRETIILCEAAGFDTIIVETVGVGQSETAVHAMVDFFLLLMLAGAGDELQGIKRGIMEMADAIAITKADGSNTGKATAAKAEYQSALHLYPLGTSGWLPQVSTCSALKNTGLDTIWQTIADYLKLTQDNGFFEKKRRDQNLQWMYEAIRQGLEDNFYSHQQVKEQLQSIADEVKDGQKSAFAAAAELLRLV